MTIGIPSFVTVFVVIIFYSQKLDFYFAAYNPA